MVFFFFQAEDGIRDWSVTGVQTCALPISVCEDSLEVDALAGVFPRHLVEVRDERLFAVRHLRSEERRVGKSVDLGGGRGIKKKKTRSESCEPGGAVNM